MRCCTKYKAYPLLIKLRCDAELTQSALAEMIGVGEETYKNHERGERPFTIHEMFAIQEVLNDKLNTNYTLDEIFRAGKSFKYPVR